MLLNSLKVSTRIYALALFNLLLILVVGAVALLQMDKIGLELVEIAEEDIPISNALTKVSQHQLEQAILFERSLAYALASQQNASYSSELQQTISQFSQLAIEVDKEFQELEEKIQHGVEHSHSQATKDKFADLFTTIKAIDQQHLSYNSAAIAFLEQTGSSTQFNFDDTKAIIKLEDEIDHKLVAAQEQIQAFTLQATLKAERDELNAIKIISVLLVFAIVLGSLLSILLARSIARPVRTVRDELQKLATTDGDLSIRLPVSGKDEMAETALAFNQLMEKLGHIVSNIRSTAAELLVHADGTVAVMRETCQQTEQQQQDSESAASAMLQMSSSIDEIAQSINSAAELSSNVLEKVQSGSHIAQQSNAVIQSLGQNVKNASLSLSELASETDRISEVLSDIRGIAEQTNLLALNAAIEAARAGETGRGFAVVADEVRSLSQRTQAATEDIQTLLQNLQVGTANAVSVMTEGEENTLRCIEQAELTSSELADANHYVETMTATYTDIAAATEEQAVVTQETNRSLSRISEHANSTYDSAVQTSANSEQMRDGVKHLSELVAELKTD